MRVVIAQIRVEREVARNSETICSFLRRAVPGDWVVFPEGALTGYFPDEADYLGTWPQATSRLRSRGCEPWSRERGVTVSSGRLGS